MLAHPVPWAVLVSEPWVFGREWQAQVGLAIDGKLSARHAQISPRGGELVVADLSSKNGTYVNGKRISTPTPLRDGDVVRAGTTLGVVRQGIERSEPASPLGDLVAPFGLAELRRRLTSRDARPGARPPLLVLGETGTGKELLARHVAEARRKPLVAVNAAAIADSLFEAELFGVEAGAATEVRPRPGIAMAAANGVLFLDEVADLSLANQAKLLRFLESGDVQPIGAARPRRVDVEVVAAAQPSLHLAVASGAFRRDLFARFVDVVELPPLSQRVEDVPSILTSAAPGSLDGAEVEAIEALLLAPHDLGVRGLLSLVRRAGQPLRHADLVAAWTPARVGQREATTRCSVEEALRRYQDGELPSQEAAARACGYSKTQFRQFLGKKAR